jgi:hypothetical protein
MPTVPEPPQGLPVPVIPPSPRGHFPEGVSKGGRHGRDPGARDEIRTLRTGELAPDEPRSRARAPGNDPSVPGRSPFQATGAALRCAAMLLAITTPDLRL